MVINFRYLSSFNQQIDKETYLKHLEHKSLTEILNFDKVKEGDTYFIESGRVHAIGAGVLLAEIQQTSDVTYRVYDWDRVDTNGNERELHNKDKKRGCNNKKDLVFLRLLKK